jgi:hypothetical protein
MPYPLPAVRGRWTRAGNGFVPTDIAGLKLWLDFSDITTLYTDSAKTTPVTADDDVIGAAEDKSGNGKDATQAVTAKKYIYKTGIQNGLSIGRSNAVDDEMEFPATIIGTGARTVFIVMKNDNAANAVGIIDLNGQANGGNGGNYDMTAEIAVRVIAGATTYDTALAQNVFSLISISNGAGETVGATVCHLNSALLGVSSAGTRAINTAADGGKLGNTPIGGVFDGDYCEALVYDTQLSVANRQAVETYFNDKWNLW